MSLLFWDFGKTGWVLCWVQNLAKQNMRFNQKTQEKHTCPLVSGAHTSNKLIGCLKHRKAMLLVCVPRATDWLLEAQEKHTCPAWSAERPDWLLEAQESSAVFAWLAERVPSWLAARKHISQNPGYTAKPQTAGTKNVSK